MWSTIIITEKSGRSVQTTSFQCTYSCEPPVLGSLSLFLTLVPSCCVEIVSFFSRASLTCPSAPHPNWTISSNALLSLKRASALGKSVIQELSVFYFVDITYSILYDIVPANKWLYIIHIDLSLFREIMIRNILIVILKSYGNVHKLWQNFGHLYCSSSALSESFLRACSIGAFGSGECCWMLQHHCWAGMSASGHSSVVEIAVKVNRPPPCFQLAIASRFPHP